MKKLMALSFLLISGFYFSACSFTIKVPEDYQKKDQDQEEDYINPDTTPEETEPEIPVIVYDEPADSLEGVDATDLSGLFTSISMVNENYTANIKGYFNEVGGYDYYRHYKRNYVCDKTSFYTENAQYTLPEKVAHLNVSNYGFLNKNNNYYRFSLKGNTKEERMNYTLVNEDLTNEVENKRYQDDLFTLADLSDAYFTEKSFTRISENKYQCTDRNVCEQFIPICAPDLINEGYYLTFSRVTIETNPDTENALRIRLYVASTQIGKLIQSHKDEENKPNWYLLFSEAYISNIGTTTFAPASSLLSE